MVTFYDKKYVYLYNIEVNLVLELNLHVLLNFSTSYKNIYIIRARLKPPVKKLCRSTFYVSVPTE